jgi:hypothetical protein
MATFDRGCFYMEQYLFITIKKVPGVAILPKHCSYQSFQEVFEEIMSAKTALMLEM